MEEFKLNVNTETVYIRAIRFLGAFILGYAVASAIFINKYGGDVNWMSTITLLLIGFSFAIFPGFAKNQSLTINDEGIFLKNYFSGLAMIDKVLWDQIKAIGLKRRVIKVEYKKGSTQTVKLPLHTEQQLSDLNNYIKRAAQFHQKEQLYESNEAVV